MNKKKIFNDPIYGLIRFHHAVLYEIIDHPYFQRLRRITQQALSHYVYPGAHHTRFEHALGALHLMTRAIETLKSKDIKISQEEEEACCIAILLHDVGHGPFSHALEFTISEVRHEEISRLLMIKIGEDIGKDFTLALSIFKGEYHRSFFHELVSGQIDIDRMDYLTRDSFFSGVAEGIIGYDRIITMINVKNEHLVIEEKGIYSIEKFLMARRLMYWQVYLHKTVISAEVMLIATLKRASYLSQKGIAIPTSEELNYFLNKSKGLNDILSDEKFIKNYVALDDMDILWMIKKSITHDDFIFRDLCSSLLHRKLFKVYTDQSPDNKILWDQRKKDFILHHPIEKEDLKFYFFEKTETIRQYNPTHGEIQILMKSGEVKPLSAINSSLFSTTETRTFWFYPQDN